MKAVLISIQPYWVFLIIAKAMGWNIEKEKTVEVRKNYPKAEAWDKTAKIYCSKDKKSFDRIPKEYQPLMKPLLGKVIGEFVCEEIYTINKDSCGWFYGTDHDAIGIGYAEDIEELWHCIPESELIQYLAGRVGYAWHISDLVVYDKPKELSEFFKSCDKPQGTDCSVCVDHRQNRCKAITRPPQSWCYVEIEVAE